MSPSSPLVSIIVPAYNAGATISKIIQKTLNQNYKNIQLIIIDDGSTDDTAKTLKKIKDPRIQIISQANQGVSVARNTGLPHVRGELIMFFDADDDISPKLITKMVNTITTDRSDIAICGLKIGNHKILPNASGKIILNSPNHVLSSVLKNSILYSPWNKIYRADIINQQHLAFSTNISYGEDLIFNLDYLKHTESISYIREPLYYYNYTSSGLSAATAQEIKYRTVMAKSLKSFASKSKKANFISAILIVLIRMRWQFSVLKSNAKRIVRG